MFLNKLNRPEKDAFLCLAHHIANCDNHFSQEEQKIIVGYCKEMSVLDIDYDEIAFDLDSILNVFTSTESKKIALIEIFALIFSDGHQIHDEEIRIITTMSEKFGISDSLVDVFANWSKSIIALINQGKSLISL